MGLFSKSEKEKADLMEEELPKRGLFLFLDIFFGRFFKFANVSLLMFGVNIFYMALLFFISPVNAQTFAVILNFESVSIQVHYDIILRAVFAIAVIVFWGAGPAGAGVSYIFRCFSSREHAWILSDFRDKALENIKQGTIAMVIDIVVLFILPLGFRFYWAQYFEKGSPIFLVFIGILVVFTFIYTFMHYFMYQMMVRFECKIKDIYKNSLILTLIRVPALFIVTVIGMVLFLIPLYFLEVYSIIIYAVLFMALIRFIFEFTASRIIEDTIEPEEGKEKILDPDRKWH